MKVVILAGGLGTRLAEETDVKPKPMVEIGGQPILWHIMKHYAHCDHSAPQTGRLLRLRSAQRPTLTPDRPIRAD